MMCCLQFEHLKSWNCGLVLLPIYSYTVMIELYGTELDLSDCVHKSPFLVVCECVIIVYSVVTLRIIEGDFIFK